MPEPSRALDRLLAIFDRRDNAGGYYYSDADVRAVIPLLVFAGGNAGREVLSSPALARIVTEFMTVAGLTDVLSPDDLKSRIEAHYASHPPNPELMAALQNFAEMEGISVDGNEVARARAFIGERPRFDDSPPPADAVRAGPLARFEIERKK